MVRQYPEGFEEANLPASAIGGVSVSASSNRNRSNGVLLGSGIPVPRTRLLRLQGRSLTSAQIDAVRAYTSPWVAGYVLAELVTGLPPKLLGLIGGDQISEEAILSCQAPERARAVLRTLGDRH